jgi:hypothetical protein
MIASLSAKDLDMDQGVGCGGSPEVPKKFQEFSKARALQVETQSRF